MTFRDVITAETDREVRQARAELNITRKWLCVVLEKIIDRVGRIDGQVR